jgi:hypothetical protein
LFLLALSLVLLLAACHEPSDATDDTVYSADAVTETDTEPETDTDTEPDGTTSGDLDTTVSETDADTDTDTASDTVTDIGTEAVTEIETRPWNPIVVDEFAAIGDVGFELVNHDASVIDRYAAAIGALAVDLDGLATVYELTAPAACCFGITAEENILLGATDPVAAMTYTHQAMQAENDRLVTEGLLKNPMVILDVCDLLGRKYAAGEYVYFRTDHHWTGLGAYYASRYFMDLVGKEYLPLSAYREVALPGFLGSLHRHTQSEELAANPDTVYGYQSPTVKTMTVCNKDGEYKQIEMVRESVSSSNKYVAFCGGDYPYSEIHNETVTDGSAVLVIKDSYGNSFMPMLADSYEYVYGIDYRSWKGDLSAFVEEHGIDTVVVINYQVCISLPSYVSAWERFVSQ